jgi:hypothetical protein
MSESVTTYADLASSKYSVLSAPVQLPGVCATCGTSRTDDRQYVDFGLFVEGIGQIYFCTFCVQELCNRMNCLTQEQSTALEDQLDAAKQEILSFQSQKARLNDAISLLRGTGLFDSSDPAAISSGLETAVEFSESSQTVPAKPTRSNSKTKQSDSKQGPVDVPATGNDELAEFDGF